MLPVIPYAIFYLIHVFLVVGGGFILELLPVLSCGLHLYQFLFDLGLLAYGILILWPLWYGNVFLAFSLGGYHEFLFAISAALKGIEICCLLNFESGLVLSLGFDWVSFGIIFQNFGPFISKKRLRMTIHKLIGGLFGPHYSR